MPAWVQTLLTYIGKGLAALFAAASVALGATIAVLVQINTDGEGAAFSDIELVAWLTIIAAGLAAFGGVLGINARQNGS
jgi:hypothetical protein